jgi:CBS domain-containing protein
MAGDVVSAAPDLTVRQAANKLRGRVIGCLPVIDGKKLTGIVTFSDLLELLGRGAVRPVERGERWTLKHRGPRRRPAATSRSGKA